MEMHQGPQHQTFKSPASGPFLDLGFYEQIINALADPIFVKDSSHRWIILNDSACRFIGKTQDELIGKSDFDVFPSEQAKVFWEKDQQVFETGVVNENEEYLTDMYGVTHTVRTRKSRYISPTGQVYLVGVIRDLTDQKNAEERRLQLISEQRVRAAVEKQKTELEEITHRLSTILDALPVGVFILGEKGEIIQTNKAAEKIWGGIAPAESIEDYREYRGWWAKDGRPLTIEDWASTRAAIHGETHVGDIIDILRFDGRCARILNSAVPLKDSHGKVEGALVICHDITELGHAETRLKESEAFLKFVIDASGLGVFDYSSIEKKLAFSPTAKTHFGMRQSTEPSYEAFIERVHPEDRERVDQIAKNAMKCGKDKRYHFECRTISIEDGRERWIAADWTVFLSPHGRPGRLIGTTMDITGQKEHEHWLKEKRDAAESSSKMKSEFLDIAAHELRTPLTPLTILIQFAQAQLGKGKPITGDMLEKFSGQIQRLTSLVDDLLNASRLERGGLDFHPVESDIRSIVEECAQDYKMRVPNRPLEIRLPEEPIWVEADPVRIHQVLGNFFENTIKYTPADSLVKVIVRLNDGKVRVEIKDQGPGISKEKQNSLFTRFYRVKTEETLQHPGLGLGLFICRRIIELHSGKIGVESEIGHGATFFFELPVKGNRKSPVPEAFT